MKLNNAIFFAVATLAATTAALADYDKPYEDAPCTITLRRIVPFKIAATSTVYRTTLTATKYIDCHGCAMTIKRMGGHGPVRYAAATITGPVTTTTTTMCSPSIR